ncbi:MAG: transposase [Planctomycetota bacterium]
MTNRGIAKRTVFERNDDVRYFLSRLAHAQRRGQLETHAFCVLPTHFHLAARSPSGDLAGAMQRVQGQYARRFNRMRRRDGSLYRGRYFSRVIDSQAYFDNVIRYIDGNAVEAGIVARPDWYPAASAYWYAQDVGPVWLTRGVVEARAAELCGAAQFSSEVYCRAFRPRLSPHMEEWMERRLRQGEVPPDPTDDILAGTPQTVLAWMRRKAALADGTGVGTPLLPRDVLLAAVETAEIQGLRPRNRRVCTSQESAAAGLLRDIGGLTYAEIAASLGCGTSCVVHRARRHRARMAADAEYAIAVSDATHRAFRFLR